VCDPYGQTPNVIAFNDVWASGGTGFSGGCASAAGINGNVSVNPSFVSKSNVQLKGGSPAIDIGYNSAPSLPTKDFANNSRIINGNDLASAIVDMGAYEFVPVVLAPKSLGFGLQAVGSNTSKTVKLTNAQNRVLNVSSYTVPTGYLVSGCGSSIAAFTSCTLTIAFHPLTSGPFKGSLVVKDDAGNSPQSVSLSGSAH
jgi:Abnormal spindle-like microcephaly-assoc'd, ASPM-SPD-2-Hydin